MKGKFWEKLRLFALLCLFFGNNMAAEDDGIWTNNDLGQYFRGRDTNDNDFSPQAENVDINAETNNQTILGIVLGLTNNEVPEEEESEGDSESSNFSEGEMRTHFEDGVQVQEELRLHEEQKRH